MAGMSNNTAVHTLIFDLGNVLIAWNPRLLYRKVFDDPAKADWFVDNIVTLEWNEEQDRGRSMTEATKFLVGKHPEWEREIRMYYDRWTEQFSGPITGSVAILQDLAAGGQYRLLALTNWSAELFPWARASFPFLSLFEDITVSGEVKLKKPDPAIYQYIQERYALGDFSGCLFIDDSARNVAGAVEQGLDAIQFVSPEKLRIALEQKGVVLANS